MNIQNAKNTFFTLLGLCVLGIGCVAKAQMLTVGVYDPATQANASILAFSAIAYSTDDDETQSGDHRLI